MAIINKGTAFSNGEQLSASKLNALIDDATFGTDSVDNSTTLVNANGAITVRDSGITAAKLTANSVTTAKITDANVTKAKIENVADYKVLGNVSGAAAAPQEVAILDEDDMVSDSATALATQQSIKAYVDANSGKIIQTKLASTTTAQSTTAVIPQDNTTPLISEGVDIPGLTATMTPASTSNLIKATLNGMFFSNASAGNVIVAVFEDNTCVGVSRTFQSGIYPIGTTYYFNSASTDQHTYTVRFGAKSGTTASMENAFGGLQKSTLFLEEVSS